MIALNKIDTIISDIGENFKDDRKFIIDLYEEISSIASDISNRPKDDMKLFPYVKTAVKATYLSRGAEGLKARNEGSISSSYDDIIAKMRNDIIKSGLRRIY